MEDVDVMRTLMSSRDTSDDELAVNGLDEGRTTISQ